MLNGRRPSLYLNLVLLCHSFMSDDCSCCCCHRTEWAELTLALACAIVLHYKHANGLQANTIAYGIARLFGWLSLCATGRLDEVVKKPPRHITIGQQFGADTLE